MEEGELEDPKAAADQLARITGLTFCPTHKPGSMVEMCLTCRAVLALVRPEVAKELMIPGKVASAVHRYSSRSDDQPPSLIMPESAIELAENVFNSGTYKNKGHWQDVVKKFLTLPPDQHERLVKDLEMEPMFTLVTCISYRTVGDALDLKLKAVVSVIEPVNGQRFEVGTNIF